MNPNTTIVASAQAAADYIDTAMAFKLAQYTIDLFADELVPHLRDDDGTGLLVSVDHVLDGKDLNACLLVLPDRTIFAWAKGMLRTKYSSVVWPNGAVTVTRGERPATRLMKARDIVTVTSDGRRFEVVFSNMCDGGRDINPIVIGTIDGAIRPVFGDGNLDAS